MADIFFSHAPEDREGALALASRLNALGLTFEMDEGALGASLDRVDEMPLTIVYWTEAAARSDHVKAVGDRASGMLRLLPVVRDKTVELRQWTARRHIVFDDFSDNAFKHAAQVISDELRFSTSAMLNFTQRLAVMSSRRGQDAPGPDKLGSFYFWRDLEPLSSETHASLGVVAPQAPYAILRDTHLVPLMVAEFERASSSYPIIFDIETKLPSAVMGIRPQTNLFLQADGSGDPEGYAPAFVRRYPFLPVTGKNGDVVICIDRSAPIISDRPDIRFFENGQPSDYTSSVIKFCQEFDVLQRQTANFVREMTDLNCFEHAAIAVPDAAPARTLSKVGEYLRLSEAKLNALPAETHLKLRESGALRIAYAHIASLGLWPKLLDRAGVLEQAGR